MPAMKMARADFLELEDRIVRLDDQPRRARYLTGDFPRAEAVKDLDTRYRWDLFWAATDGGRRRIWASGTYDDAHVDTALRRIVPPLSTKASTA